jgi:peptidyl-prolyl cis-trans isomerase A (cyclophilin A)
MNPAAWTRQAPPEFKAKFTTTKGDFVVDVHRAWAPLGADRFFNLVRSGFFTNVSFYRVVPNFVVQFGAAPDPKVEAAWNNARIKDDPVKSSNKKYALTFAMGGPNTRTTEIFINLRDNAMLDGMGFSPFGEVSEGKEIVDQIYSGYGDMQEQGGGGPSQARVQMEGKPYLDKNFPKLDSIKSASIVGGEPPAAAPAKAAAKSAAPAVKKSQPVPKKADAK